MPYIVIRNLCRYPLYLNLPRGRGVKLRSRGTAEVEDADLQCQAISFHRSRGNVVVLQKPQGQSTRWDASAPLSAGLQPSDQPSSTPATPLKDAGVPRAKATKPK